MESKAEEIFPNTMSESTAPESSLDEEHSSCDFLSGNDFKNTNVTEGNCEASNDCYVGCEEESKVDEIENSNDNNEDIILETLDITPEKSGGVMKQIVKEGEGDEFPGYGDKVCVHYTGWLLNNKERPVMFDSSRKGEKCEFNLGRGMVIKGWDLGISTMKKGEVAIFICQPEYAYGEMGHPPTIPPYTPLLFEVELFGWKLEDLSPRKDNGILRKVLEKGEGTTTPNEGSKVKVYLIGYRNEELFQEKEVSFILGEGCSENIPEGVEIALLRFRLHEKSLIYIKNKYAYDTKGILNHDITPDTDLKFEVTLLNFEKVKDVWEMNSDEKFVKAKLSKEKGISFFQDGNYKVALKQFKWIPTCLENEPGAPADSEDSRKALLLSGYLNIALCLLKLENYIDAIKVCDKALDIDPENEKALFRRGQARMFINDCEIALQDFEKLCRIKPENKAARSSIILCQEKIRKQNLKDKNTYDKMFEKFVKQDEERLKNIKTETGVWQNDKREERREAFMSEAQRFLERSNSALLDANIIELSNTAH